MVNNNEAASIYIFLSFSEEDKALADRLYTDLTLDGFRVWAYHRDGKPGDDFPKQIDAKLEECTVMLALVSQFSVDSGFCRNEWTFFKSTNKRIIPVKIGDDFKYPTSLLATNVYVEYAALDYHVLCLKIKASLLDNKIIPFPQTHEPSAVPSASPQTSPNGQIKVLDVKQFRPRDHYNAQVHRVEFEIHERHVLTVRIEQALIVRAHLTVALDDERIYDKWLDLNVGKGDYSFALEGVNFEFSHVNWGPDWAMRLLANQDVILSTEGTELGN